MKRRSERSELSERFFEGRLQQRRVALLEGFRQRDAPHRLRVHLPQELHVNAEPERNMPGCDVPKPARLQCA